MPKTRTREPFNAPMIGLRLSQAMYDRVTQEADEYGTAAQVIRAALNEFFLRRDVRKTNGSGKIDKRDEVSK